MARPVRSISILLTVEYVPVPEDRIGVWRGSLLLLVDLLREEKRLFLRSEVEDGTVDIGDPGDVDGGVAALFSLAFVTEGEEVASVGGLYAWVVGHDGSVHCMAMADW